MVSRAKDTHTTNRVIRIPDDDWQRFDVAAREAGTERAALVRAFIAWYLHRPGAKLPKRPDAQPPRRPEPEE